MTTVRAILPLLLVASMVPLSGCVGELVLPKTLNLYVEYNSDGSDEAARFSGAEYEISIYTPNDTLLFHDEGVFSDGFSREHTIVFEEVGPYNLKMTASHPTEGGKQIDVPFDFRVICRSTSELDVSAIYIDGELDLSIDGGGPLCQLPG